MRFTNFLLLLLAAITFFVGLNLGKKIQALDTPVKTITKKEKITIAPKISLLTGHLKSCDFSFTYPSNFEAQESSNSAIINSSKEMLKIECTLSASPSGALSLWQNRVTGKRVAIFGSPQIFKQLQEAFDSRFQSVD